jgi:prefoldin subunit 5
MELIHLIVVTVALLGTAVGVWVNLNNDITKLKSRVYHLEQKDNDIKALLADITARLQHIEILLASNQIKEK